MTFALRRLPSLVAVVATVAPLLATAQAPRKTGVIGAYTPPRARLVPARTSHLPHPRHPSLSAGLPDHPHCSPIVGLLKGVMQPISLAAIAFAGVFGLMHYVTRGPNRVSETDERKAAELSGSDRA